MAKFEANALTYPAAMANPFPGTIDVNQAIDQVFDPPARGLLITATGDIKVTYDGDGSIRTIPVFVVSGGNTEFRGHMIRQLFSTANGSTATVLCGLK